MVIILPWDFVLKQLLVYNGAFKLYTNFDDVDKFNVFKDESQLQVHISFTGNRDDVVPDETYFSFADTSNIDVYSHADLVFDDTDFSVSLDFSVDYDLDPYITAIQSSLNTNEFIATGFFNIDVVDTTFDYIIHTFSPKYLLFFNGSHGLLSNTELQSFYQSFTDLIVDVGQPDDEGFFGITAGYISSIWGKFSGAIFSIPPFSFYGNIKSATTDILLEVEVQDSNKSYGCLIDFKTDEFFSTNIASLFEHTSWKDDIKICRSDYENTEVGSLINQVNKIFVVIITFLLNFSIILSIFGFVAGQTSSGIIRNDRTRRSMHQKEHANDKKTFKHIKFTKKK